MSYYQNLLNECIDLTEDYQRLNRMKTTLLKMKENLLNLKRNKVQKVSRVQKVIQLIYLHIKILIEKKKGV